MIAKGKEVEEERKVDVSRCKLLYIEWINNKLLLHSTENYSQYHMINHSEKDCIKVMYIYVCVYIYIYESLSCTTIINITL